MKYSAFPFIGGFLKCTFEEQSFLPLTLNRFQITTFCKAYILHSFCKNGVWHCRSEEFNQIVSVRLAENNNIFLSFLVKAP
jgi:hypothetical protein